MDGWTLPLILAVAGVGLVIAAILDGGLAIRMPKVIKNYLSSKSWTTTAALPLPYLEDIQKWLYVR